MKWTIELIKVTNSQCMNKLYNYNIKFLLVLVIMFYCFIVLLFMIHIMHYNRYMIN